MSGDPRPVLVVGLGLAGALMTLALQRRGRAVVVADGGGAVTSRAAAGLVSPINGPRLSRPPRTGEWLAAATDLYADAEGRLGVRLWYPGTIRRLFRDAVQAQRWEERRADPVRGANMGPAEPPGRHPQGLDIHGSGPILGGGRLDVAGLLDAVARERAEAGRLRGTVEPAELEPVADGVRLAGEEYAAAVLCQGWEGARGAWLRDLPLEPLAGESLALRLPAGRPAEPLHGSGWLVPTGPDAARLGATHHRAVSGGPTASGRAELLAALPGLWSGAAEVVGHFAGTRVAVRDRAPVAGPHPRWPRLALFNGLGGKGALWGPWCAEAVADYLVSGEPVPAEIDPGRFGVDPCG
ncbi:MAG: NAD(P)/FAD-dependent oxidoreductase [Thiohalospira sp.]